MTDVQAHFDALLTGIRVGGLEVRLAAGEEEIAASQALRYRVFYQEMDAHPTEEMARVGRDFDDLDPFCDHLLVFDHTRGHAPAESVIATYRLIRREAAMRHGGFYTADEFDISPVDSQFGEILELGRSCVARDYRNRPTMQLMWRGIASYVFHYGIEIMFGCGSFHGTDPDAHAEPLSFLYYQHLAPQSFRPRALPDRYVAMNRIPEDGFDPKQALSALPPLIKGYLRLGGFVGDGAVIDPQFNTTDVCILVKTDLITDKYIRHYGREAREQAAG